MSFKALKNMIEWWQGRSIIQSINECSFKPFYKEFVGAVSAANGIAIIGPLQYYGLFKFLVPKNRVSNRDGKKICHHLEISRKTTKKLEGHDNYSDWLSKWEQRWTRVILTCERNLSVNHGHRRKYEREPERASIFIFGEKALGVSCSMELAFSTWDEVVASVSG